MQTSLFIPAVIINTVTVDKKDTETVHGTSLRRTLLPNMNVLLADSSGVRHENSNLPVVDWDCWLTNSLGFLIHVYQLPSML